VTAATLKSNSDMRQAFILLYSISCLTFSFFKLRVLLVEQSLSVLCLCHSVCVFSLSLCVCSLCVRLLLSLCVCVLSLCVCVCSRLCVRVISLCVCARASTAAVNHFLFSDVLAFTGFCFSGAGSAG